MDDPAITPCAPLGLPLPHDSATLHVTGEALYVDDLPEPPSLVVIDVSFIPLSAALPPVLAFAAPGAALVALVKPQFEAGRAHIGKGGIVKDPAVHAEVCARAEALVREAGWNVRGVIPSPIAGGEGNREFLLAADKPC